MNRPSEEIEGCRRAHARMTEVLAEVSEAVAARPSLLPGWTVGHVITHLARNAEAMHRRVEGVLRGELVDQYVGGVAGRAAEIGNGAARPVHEIVEDVCDWSSRLDELFATLPAATWPQPVRTVLGGQHPVALLPFRRWREVEVHLVDLDLGFSCADWSQDLVERALPRLISGLPDRADRRDLMAWILGRASPPELERWG